MVYIELPWWARLMIKFLIKHGYLPGHHFNSFGHLQCPSFTRHGARLMSKEEVDAEVDRVLGFDFDL